MERGKHQILIGDARHTLRTLAAGSVHCAVTSPPYFRLRSYLADDHPSKGLEIGGEQTPEQFIAALVALFDEVRRVLRDDGLLFVNIGDSYNNFAGNRGASSGKANRKHHDIMPAIPARNGLTVKGLQDGDKMNIPERFALAMQAAGWCHRDTIIWFKPSPMPTSQNGFRWERCKVKVGGSERAGDGTRHAEATNGKPQGARDGKAFDSKAEYEPCPGCKKCRENGGRVLRRGKFRTTTSHEPIFMFSKGKRYFCDAEAVKEKAVGGTPGNTSHKGAEAYAEGDEKHRTKAGLSEMVASESRLPRSVWRIPFEPLKEKHFAAFPGELARRCIAMATSSRGCCPACGAQYAPVVDTERVPTRPGNQTKVGRASASDDSPYHAAGYGMIVGNRDPQRHLQRTNVLDYWPTCDCGAGDPIPATVLDPFLGSGRAIQVAVSMGRDGIGCELNPEYAEMAERRINTPWQPKSEKKPKAKRKRREAREQPLLFGEPD